MKLLKNRRGAVLALVSAASLFVACGGGDDNGDGDGDGDTASGGTQDSGDGDGDSSGGDTSSSGGNLSSSGGDSSSSGGDSSNSGGTTASGGAPSGGQTSSGGDENLGGGDMGGGDVGGMGGDGGEPDCDPTYPPFNVQARNDVDSWGANDFDDVVVTEGACGTAILSAIYPHETGWENADPGESNMEATQFALEFWYGDQSLVGKQLDLSIKLLDDGRGSSAENGGYDISLGANDENWTESGTPWAEAHGFYNAGSVVHLTHVIPDAEGDWDPSLIHKLVVRVASKYWGDGSVVFDYEEPQFEILSLTITDAP